MNCILPSSLILLLMTSSVRCYGGNNNNYVSGAPSNFQNQNRPNQRPHNHHHHTHSNQQSADGISEVFGWNQIDFQYPNRQARQEAIRSGAFNQSTIIPIGVAASGPRVFITMPKWRAKGTPATIATVLFPSNSTTPLLSPYPSWLWHRPGDCEGITSVFRVKADECGRLWVLDTGRVNTFDTPQQLCPPQVHVFDLNNDQLIYRYRFPAATIKPDSLLVSIEVEYPVAQCGGNAGVNGAVIYVADATTFSLIVADLKREGDDSAWRINDKTMYPAPEAGTFTVNGDSFEFMDGILGLGLSPRNNQAERTLYYHSMSSFRQYWVRTSVLRNSTAAVNSPRAFQASAQTRPGQAAGCSMNQNGILFFGLVTRNSLACWNSRKPFTPQNIGTIAEDNVALQFISTATVDPDDRLWALSMRFQSVLSNTLSRNDANFRVFMSPSSATAVKGTICERGGQPQGAGNHNQQLVFRP